jgi:hypothetical protein
MRFTSIYIDEASYITNLEREFNNIFPALAPLGRVALISTPNPEPNYVTQLIEDGSRSVFHHTELNFDPFG